MSDLISREAAINALENWQTCDRLSDWNDGLDKGIIALRALPSVSVTDPSDDSGDMDEILRRLRSFVWGAGRRDKVGK